MAMNSLRLLSARRLVNHLARKMIAVFFVLAETREEDQKMYLVPLCELHRSCVLRGHSKPVYTSIFATGEHRSYEPDYKLHRFFELVR